MDFNDLAVQCAPDINYKTLSAIVKIESNFNPLAISDDGYINLPYSKRKHMLRSFKPADTKSAIKLAKQLIQAGHIVGIGLGQINHRNLASLGFTVEQAFNPCNNLQMINKLLTANYSKAFSIYKNEKKALIASLSMYNTGSTTSGVANGYVAKLTGSKALNSKITAVAVNESRYVSPAYAPLKINLNHSPLKVALN